MAVAIVAMASISEAAVVGRNAHATAEGLTIRVAVAPRMDVAGVIVAGRAVVAVTHARIAGQREDRGIDAHPSAQGLAIKGVGALHDAATVAGANPSARTHGTSLAGDAASIVSQTRVT